VGPKCAAQSPAARVRPPPDRCRCFPVVVPRQQLTLSHLPGDSGSWAIFATGRGPLSSTAVSVPSLSRARITRGIGAKCSLWGLIWARLRERELVFCLLRASAALTGTVWWSMVRRRSTVRFRKGAPARSRAFRVCDRGLRGPKLPPWGGSFHLSEAQITSVTWAGVCRATGERFRVREALWPDERRAAILVSHRLGRSAMGTH
jgi:hypothetical protein